MMHFIHKDICTCDLSARGLKPVVLNGINGHVFATVFSNLQNSLFMKLRIYPDLLWLSGLLRLELKCGFLLEVVVVLRRY